MQEAPEVPNVHDLRKAEHLRILTAAQEEWAWWGKPKDRYGTNEERERAITAGKLIPVDWSAGIDNGLFGVAHDLHTNDGLSSRFLRPEAHAFFHTLLNALQEKLTSLPFPIRPIITSLHRLDDAQGVLAESESWYRAAPAGKSSHAAGAAFDIQAGKYYVKNARGELRGTWLPEYANTYIAEYNDLIRETLRPFIEQGIAHCIEEYAIDDVGNKTLAVFHVCIAPTNERESEPSQ